MSPFDRSSSDSGDSGAPVSNSTVYVDKTTMQYVQVVVSFATCLALLFLCIIMLVYRSTARNRILLHVRRYIRFHASAILSENKKKHAQIILEGLKKQENAIVDPPQYNRLVPAVVRDCRDSRLDCAEMLDQTRRLLRRTEGRNANLMSMRGCLSCVKAVLPHNRSEHFLQVYEKISFGSQRMDGSSSNVSSDDIKFMHAFFYNTILKELE